jgi:hypothetical protein
VTPEDGRLGLKHIVLIAKAKVKEKINSCIIDGKLYVTIVEYSTATGCLNTSMLFCYVTVAEVQRIMNSSERRRLWRIYSTCLEGMIGKAKMFC